MKIQLTLGATLALLLTACSGPQDDQKAAPEVEQQQEVPETESNQPEEDAALDEEAPEEPEIEETPEIEYQLTEANWTLKPVGEASEKVILLTIDDAPDTYSLQMAETLSKLEVPAIFFVNGHFIDSEEEKKTLKQIHDLGFVIGNHTQTHANLKDISEQQQKEEILMVSQTVEETIGEKPVFFRAPFGVNTDYSRTLAEEEGMLVMNWTYGYDWESDYRDPEALADIMVNTPYLVDGANLLMHDREWTAGALEGIVEGLRAKGYEFLDPRLIEVPIQ